MEIEKMVSVTTMEKNVHNRALLNTAAWWLRHDCQPPAESMVYTFSRLAAPGVLEVLGLD